MTCEQGWVERSDSVALRSMVHCTKGLRGTQIINERFNCHDLMSDPGVSGTEVLEIKTIVYGHYSGVWTAEGSIAN